MDKHTIKVSLVLPSALVGRLDELVKRQAARTGETPEAVRRAVQIAALQRGIAALEAELAEHDQRSRRDGAA